MLINDKAYFETLEAIKTRIATSHRNVVVSINTELTELYWHIGGLINAKAGYGNKFVENLSRDLKLEFPNMKGFSPRNLYYMSKLAEEYPTLEILQQAAAKLPWGHIMWLMDNVRDKEKRNWYSATAVENGWSRSILMAQVETDLYTRQIATSKVTNFATTLPSPHSDMVKHAMKDPYYFNWVSEGEDATERELEKSLVADITKLLLELGTGFACIGHQYHIEVENEDYYIDMLFFNVVLNCYVVIELKTVEFKPEFAGKLNFYISAVDDKLKKKTHNPTIGLLLCKGKKELTAEYALRDLKKPIGVSEYKLSRQVPKELKDVLPSAEDIKSRIKID